MDSPPYPAAPEGLPSDPHVSLPRDTLVQDGAPVRLQAALRKPRDKKAQTLLVDLVIQVVWVGPGNLPRGLSYPAECGTPRPQAPSAICIQNFCPTEF